MGNLSRKCIKCFHTLPFLRQRSTSKESEMKRKMYVSRGPFLFGLNKKNTSITFKLQIILSNSERKNSIPLHFDHVHNG